MSHNVNQKLGLLFAVLADENISCMLHDGP